MYCTVWMEESPLTKWLNRNLQVLPYSFFMTHPCQECKCHFIRGGGDQKLSEVHVKELCLSESVHQRLVTLRWCQTGKWLVSFPTCWMQSAVTSNEPMWMTKKWKGHLWIPRVIYATLSKPDIREVFYFLYYNALHIMLIFKLLV